MAGPQTAQTDNEPRIGAKWLSVLVGCLLSVLMILLWWSLLEQQETVLQQKIEAKADKMAGYIKSDMRGRIPSLQRIVNRWIARKGVPKEEFIIDINAYIEDQPGFQAIGWADRDNIIRWIVPRSGSENVLNQNMAFDEIRKAAMEKAKSRNKPMMTLPLDLVQGGKGFLAYFPIFINGDFDGFVLAVFRIQEWLDYIFNISESEAELKNFKVAVFVNEMQIFQQSGWRKDQKIRAASTIEIEGIDFRVLCQPTELFLNENSSSLTHIVGIIGLLLSVLIAFVVHLFQKATIEAWRAHAAKVSLEKALVQNENTSYELQQAYSQINLATRAGNIGVWVWNMETNELTWNSIMYELYDLPPDVTPTYEIWQNLIHPEDVEKTEALLKDAVRGKSAFDTEFRICPEGKEHRVIRAAARTERDNSGKSLLMTGVNWDITERTQYEEKIRYLATHDALTDLPSLRLARDRILMGINRAHRTKHIVAVMFIDLDGFKTVNDTYGHQFGDELLKEIARRLLSCVRETDTVARFGGDEFLIILTELQERNDVSLIAEKLTKTVSKPVFIKGNRAVVGASIGIALFPDDGEDVEGLIQKADEAMYRIKKSGKNDFAFSDS